MFFFKWIRKKGEREPLLANANERDHGNDSDLLTFIKNIKALRTKVDSKDPAYNPFTFMEVEGGASSLSNEILLNAYDAVLAAYNKGEYDYLTPGEGKAYKRPKAAKRINSAIRSLAVVRADDGKFQLYIRTKSKFSFNIKRRIKWPGGSFKKCKLCFLVSEFPFIPCADLVSKIKNNPKNKTAPKHLIADRNEHSFAGELFAAAPNLFPKVTRFEEQRGAYTYIHRFMPHVQYDLQKFIDANQTQPHLFTQLDKRSIQFGSKKVPVWKMDIIRQSLLILLALEGNNIANRDLKLENILLRVDPVTKRPVIKCIDPGFATRYGYQVADGGTLEYAPPELFEQRYRNLLQVIVGKNAPQAEREAEITTAKMCFIGVASQGNNQDSLGLQAAVRMVASDSSTAEKLMNKDVRAWRGEHDRWSAAIMMFVIINEDFPLYKDRNPDVNLGLATYLKQFIDTPIPGLLQIDPTKRISAAEALAMFDSLIPDELDYIQTTPVVSDPDYQINSATIPHEIWQCVKDLEDLRVDDRVETTLADLENCFVWLGFKKQELKIPYGPFIADEDFIREQIQPLHETIQSLMLIKDPQERKRFCKNQGTVAVKKANQALTKFKGIETSMLQDSTLKDKDAAILIMLQMRIRVLQLFVVRLEEKMKPNPNNKKINGLISALIPELTRGIGFMHMLDGSFNARFSAKA